MITVEIFHLLIVNRSVRYYVIFRFRSNPAGYMDCWERMVRENLLFSI